MNLLWSMRFESGHEEEPGLCSYLYLDIPSFVWLSMEWDQQLGWSKFTMYLCKDIWEHIWPKQGVTAVLGLSDLHVSSYICDGFIRISLTQIESKKSTALSFIPVQRWKLSQALSELTVQWGLDCVSRTKENTSGQYLWKHEGKGTTIWSRFVL